MMKRHFNIAIFLCLLVVFFETASAAPAIKASSVGDSLHVVFASDTEIKVEDFVKDREIILQFNQPIDALDTTGVYDSFPEWMAEFSNSYDRLIFSTKKDSHFQMVMSGRIFTLIITPLENQKNTEEDILTQANIMIIEGRYLEARRLLRPQIEANPGDTQALSLYAQAQRGLHDYASVLSSYMSILETTPHDISSNYGKQLAFSELASAASIGYRYQDYDEGEYHHIISYGLKTLMTEQANLVISGKSHGVKVDNVRGLDGESRNYDFKHHHKADISLVYHYDYGLDIIPTLYLSNEIIGGGIALANKLGNGGRIYASANYHEPDYDSARQIVLNAFKNYIATGYQSDFNNGWSWGVEGRYVNYGYKDMSDVADSIDTHLTVSYEVMPTKQDSVVFLYSIDGRYMLREKEGRDSYNNVYGYASASTNEVHSISATWVARMARDIILSPYLGYSYDRYNKGGVFYGVRLQKQKLNHFDFEVYAGKGISTYDGSGRDIYSLGMNFILKY